MRKRRKPETIRHNHPTMKAIRMKGATVTKEATTTTMMETRAEIKEKRLKLSRNSTGN